MPSVVIDPSTAAAAPTTTAGDPLTSVGDTLADYREEVLLELGNRTDVNNTKLDRWINQGYRYIAAMVDLKELWASVGLSFVADQPFYTVPVVLSWIKRINLEDDTDFPDTGGSEMEMIDEQTYRTLPDSDEVQVDGSTFPPMKYFRYQRIIVVWPTPVTSYDASMDFRVRPAKLVDATDSPILPEDFHEAIGRAALWRARRGVRAFKEAALAQNDMLTCLRPLINADGEERDAMHMVAQPIRTGAELYRRF